MRLLPVLLPMRQESALRSATGEGSAICSTTVREADMRILLNTRQVEQLQPYFDRVRAAAQRGNPGMLVAQIRRDDKEGDYWFEPQFLPHAYAEVLTMRGRREIPGDLRQEPQPASLDDPT
jgi:hypothetical protein